MTAVLVFALLVVLVVALVWAIAMAQRVDNQPPTTTQDSNHFRDCYFVDESEKRDSLLRETEK